MKSSIYISSEKIEVIGYAANGKSIAVKDHMSYPLTEGSMINGKFTDPSHMAECLDSMRKKNPALFAEPTLIVDGNSIFSKKISSPKLNKRQYIQLILNEFADATQDSEELVCDYQVLKKAGKAGGAPVNLFAGAADKTQVETYIDTFQKAGIKLKGIRIGTQAVQNYVDITPALQKSAFVLNIVDGFTLFSMIFDNGVNVFMSRTRIYSENSEEFAQSLLSNLSGFIQFNRSENFNDISASYYLGMKPEDLNFMSAISPYPDIKIDSLGIFGGIAGAGNLPIDAHFALLNAQLGTDSIDLMRGCKSLEKLKKHQRPKQFFIPGLAIIVGILCIPTAILFARLYQLDRGIEAINNFLTDPAVVAKSEELDALQAEITRFNYSIDQLNGKLEQENSKAAITNKILDLVTGTTQGKITVTRFNFDERTGLLTVNGSGASETSSAEFVNALKASGIVEDILYVGYSFNSSSSEYDFKIDLVLAVSEVSK